jgi:hypothetical protein
LYIIDSNEAEGNKDHKAVVTPESKSDSLSHKKPAAVAAKARLSFGHEEEELEEEEPIIPFAAAEKATIPVAAVGRPKQATGHDVKKLSIPAGWPKTNPYGRDHHITKICDLRMGGSPLARVIKGVVISKSILREYTSGSRNGTVGHVVVRDEHGGTIRVALFDTKQDKFDTLEEGKVYMIKGGLLKTMDTKYNNSVSSQYEMTFPRGSFGFEAVQGDEIIIDPTLNMDNNIRISELQCKNNQQICAKVVYKSEAREFLMPSQDDYGQVFSVKLEDVYGDTIYGKFFNAALDKFMDMITVDEIYVFSGFTVKYPSNPDKVDKEQKECSSKYELIFEKFSVIMLAEEVEMNV